MSAADCLGVLPPLEIGHGILPDLLEIILILLKEIRTLNILMPLIKVAIHSLRLINLEASVPLPLLKIALQKDIAIVGLEFSDCEAADIQLLFGFEGLGFLDGGEVRRGHARLREWDAGWAGRFYAASRYYQVGVDRVFRAFMA